VATNTAERLQPGTRRSGILRDDNRVADGIRNSGDAGRFDIGALAAQKFGSNRCFRD